MNVTLDRDPSDCRHCGMPLEMCSDGPECCHHCAAAPIDSHGRPRFGHEPPPRRTGPRPPLP